MATQDQDARGDFVVVSLCDAWGLPQFSNMLHWLKTMAEENVWRPLCLIMHDIMLKMCTVYKKEVICICCMYKIFVCTKYYVQKIFVCTKKYYTWYFKNLFLLGLSFLHGSKYLKKDDWRYYEIRFGNQSWQVWVYLLSRYKYQEFSSHQHWL